MVVSLILAASFTLLSAFMTSWQAILLTRACIGLSLSGVAAVAMTYLSEEIHPSVVAFSMGLYISGNSIGGMSSRLLSQAVVGLLSVVYLTGSWSSPKASALTARYGRGPVMMVAILIMVAGLLLTLLAQLVAIFIGMMLFAGGFLPRIPSPAVGLAAARVVAFITVLLLVGLYVAQRLRWLPELRAV